MLSVPVLKIMLSVLVLKIMLSVLMLKIMLSVLVLRHSPGSEAETGSYSSTDDAADERRRPRASTTSSAPSLYMADARQLPGRRDAIPFHPLQQRLGVNNDVLQSLPDE